MPAKYFICPDGQHTTIENCLKECRLCKELPAGRCLSARTLRAISDSRVWTGKPSTTQLLKGTREAYLEIIHDYAIDPQKSLFMLQGTKAHGELEKYVGKNELSEIRLDDGTSTGMFDFYDSELKTLFDNKVSGSYKIRKALGKYSVDVPTGEVYKTGEKKGLPKTRKEWADGGYRDCLDWKIQLNDYRIKLEQCGFPVEKMFIEAIARDGGIQAAWRNGIEQNGVLIEINKIPDRHVKAYMDTKASLLINALNTKTTPPECNARECWHGRKCNGYCNVFQFCREGKEIE